MGHHRVVDDDGPPEPPLRVEMWVDVICPWAYLGLDRTRLLRGLGIEVHLRAYELHPELPEHPRRLRPGGRLEAVHRRIAGECASVGLPFRVPTTIVNSREVLEWTEAVAATDPDVADALWERLFQARFVGDRSLDRELLEELTDAIGADPPSIAAAVRAGVGARRLVTGRSEAHDAGVAATPGWVFSSGLAVVGVQPQDQFRRWARRLLEGAGERDRRR